MPLLAVKLYLLALRAQFYAQQALRPLKPLWDCLQYTVCCRRAGAYGLGLPDDPDEPIVMRYEVDDMWGDTKEVFGANEPHTMLVLGYHLGDPAKKCLRVLYGNPPPFPKPLPLCEGRDLQSLPFFDCEIEYADGARESVYEDLLPFRLKGNVIAPKLIRAFARRPGMPIRIIHVQSMDFTTGLLETKPLPPEGIVL